MQEKRWTKKFSLALAIALIFALSLAGTAFAATSGPRNAGTGADAPGVGTVSWSSPGYITADDSNNATANIGASAITHYL